MNAHLLILQGETLARPPGGGFGGFVREFWPALIAALLGLLCAAAGILMMRGVAFCESVFGRLKLRFTLRTALGGILIGLLAVDRVSAWVAFVIVAREFTILGLRAAVAGGGSHLETSLFGKWKAAARNLHSTNNFPEVTGRVCPAPCEASCTLNIDDQPATKVSPVCWRMRGSPSRPSANRSGTGDGRSVMQCWTRIPLFV